MELTIGTWLGTTAAARLVASVLSSFYVNLAWTAQNVMDAWRSAIGAWPTLIVSPVAGSVLLFVIGVLPWLVLRNSSRAVVSYAGAFTAATLLASSITVSIEGLLAPGCPTWLAVCCRWALSALLRSRLGMPDQRQLSGSPALRLGMGTHHRQGITPCLEGVPASCCPRHGAGSKHPYLLLPAFDLVL